MQKIYIDIGNSYTKFTNLDFSKVFKIKTSLLEKTVNWDNLDIWQKINQWPNKIVKIYISCVRINLKSRLEQYFINKAELFFLNYENQKLITIKNATEKGNTGPKEIGADIVANAIATSKLQRAIVISLGTGIVYFVIEKSQIQGVAIDSGFNLTKESLMQKIWGENQDNWVSINTPLELLGQNTSQALSSGLINSKVFAINAFIKHLFLINTHVIFTGGDYKFLEPSFQKYFTFKYCYEDNLVLQGLRIWAETLI